MYFFLPSRKTLPPSPSATAQSEDFVDKIQSELRIKHKSHATNQRAKLSYEEELTSHILPTFSRASRDTPSFSGHVKNYNRHEKCDEECHYQRSLRDINDMSYETLDVSGKKIRSTSLRFDNSNLSMENMVNNYLAHEALEKKMEEKTNAVGGRSKVVVFICF